MKFIGGIYHVIVQICSFLSGNTNFFNLLLMLIALSLFEDRLLDSYFPNALKILLSIPIENKQQMIDKRNEKQKYIPSLINRFVVNLLVQVRRIFYSQNYDKIGVGHNSSLLFLLPKVFLAKP